LQAALRVEQAIVATTDRRDAVAAYGREQGVLVLDGSFLARLLPALEGHLAERISEEDFNSLLNAYVYNQGPGGWKDRYDRAKSLVLASLSYHSINCWLDDAKYFFEQSIIIQSHSEVALRAFYSIASLIAVGFDFVIKDAAFVEPRSKAALIASGLRYGDGGKDGATRALKMALALIENYAEDGKGLSNRLKHRVEADFQSVDVAALAEFFSRGSVAANLFNVARELEKAAFSRNFIVPSVLTVESQSLLAVLVDWWGLDRHKLFNAAPRDKKSDPPSYDLTTTNAVTSSSNDIEKNKEKIPDQPAETPKKKKRNQQKVVTNLENGSG
jgi:hypothetical protein